MSAINLDSVVRDDITLREVAPSARMVSAMVAALSCLRDGKEWQPSEGKVKHWLLVRNFAHLSGLSHIDAFTHLVNGGFLPKTAGQSFSPINSRLAEMGKGSAIVQVKNGKSTSIYGEAEDIGGLANVLDLDLS